MWKHKGQQRPDFAIVPGPNQESVWDYPRPPALQKTTRRVQVIASGIHIADTVGAWRLLETASPPTYYLPVTDIDMKQLLAIPGHSLCEWKGLAQYFGRPDNPTAAVAWGYPDSNASYSVLQNCLSFYPGRIECFVDNEQVKAQPGEFYGGWITTDVVGPFKGEPGTGHW